MNDVMKNITNIKTMPSRCCGRIWRPCLAALCIFGSGVIVGGVSTVGLVRHKIIQHRQQPSGYVVERIMKRLDRRLNLSGEQFEKINVIVEERVQALRSIRDEALPRVRVELDASREAVAQELDAAQEKKWREGFSRLEDFFPPYSEGGE